MIFIFSVENKKFNFSENNRLEKTDNNKSIEEGVTSFCGFINYAQLVNETVTHIDIYIYISMYICFFSKYIYIYIWLDFPKGAR